MRNTELSFRERVGLKFQRFIGWFTFPVWGSILIGLMRFGAGYRIQQIREIRRRYRELLETADGPVLLCPNHLTMIDSAILNWSLLSVWTNIKSFKALSWNLPEKANFYKNPLLRTLCYIGSCIPVERGGNRDSVKKSLNKVMYLLRKGYPVTVFPEGTRSRSGRIDIDGFSYGVGRLVNLVEDCKVLCVYLRGHKQDKYSGIPRRGSRFYLDMQLIQPVSVHSGLRATRDVAGQIITQLQEMEHAYFSRGWHSLY